ncbi:peptidoglycan-binding protein [Jhaorihella thermophila]
MFRRKVFASLLATTMIVTPVTRAMADNNAAALLGGAILGGIIVNEVNKNKQRKQATAARQRSSSYQRAQNRDIQTALNYFGYPAGAADGVLGRRSRAAIAQFQAEMGYTADGYLDAYERDFLLNSYQRALVSAQVPPYNQILAAQGAARAVARLSQRTARHLHADAAAGAGDEHGDARSRPRSRPRSRSCSRPPCRRRRRRARRGRTRPLCPAFRWAGPAGRSTNTATRSAF